MKMPREARAFRGYDGEHFPDHEFEGLFGKGVHGTKINDMSRDDLFEITGGRTVPQIVVDGKTIGGYTDLVELDSNGLLIS